MNAKDTFITWWNARWGTSDGAEACWQRMPARDRAAWHAVATSVAGQGALFGEGS